MSASSTADPREPGRFELDVPPAAEGQRLDRFLAAGLPEMSRARLQALVREGRLALAQAGDAVREPSRPVRAGERYVLSVPPPVPADPAAEEGRELDVLFEDEHLLVLVKPAGLVVHPAPGHRGGTLVNALLAHCKGGLSGIGGVERPGIVHRLDKEVSGVMVAAKSDRAHVGLAGQFTVHSVDRVYEGIAWGVPGAPSGTVDAPIGRHPSDRLRMAVVRGNAGKRAVTHWRRLEAAGTRASRLEVRLETGRTHQIRVHMASLGHPLVGDRLYARRLPPGAAPLALDRVLLHARRLGFVHPLTGEALAFESPVPDLFGRVLATFRPSAMVEREPNGRDGR